MPVPLPDSHCFQNVDEVPPGQRLLGIRGESHPGPQGYFVHTSGEVDTHFHDVDQFQMMFGGTGTYYQRHEVPANWLHYADAYSVYGPFGGTPEHPLDFFTLRGEMSTMHASMPESRDKLLYRGACTFHIDLEMLMDKDLPSENASELTTLIPTADDGLAASFLALGPGGSTTPPSGELRTGRYTVVLEGSIQLDGDPKYGGREFARHALGWTSGEVSELTLLAGRHGAQILLLNLPYPSTPSVRLAKV